MYVSCSAKSSHGISMNDAQLLASKLLSQLREPSIVTSLTGTQQRQKQLSNTNSSVYDIDIYVDYDENVFGKSELGDTAAFTLHTVLSNSDFTFALIYAI